MAAEQLFQKLLDTAPDHADANNFMGVIALKQEGKHDNAIQYIKKAIQINPAKAAFHNNLGFIFKQNGNLEEAVKCYRRAITLGPQEAGFHNNLGNTLQELDRIPEAIASYRNALDAKPDFAEVYNNLGAALQISGNLTEAMNSFNQALLLKPDFADAYYNLGLLLCASGMQDESIASCRKALSLRPDISSAHSNLLFVMNYSPNISQEDIYRESLRFAELHASIKDCSTHTPSQSDIKRRKLRIGYVSPDFRTHSIAFFFEPLLKAHNRERHDIYCYSDVKNPDKITERLQRETDFWRTIAWKKDEDVVVQIKIDLIDILVDLSGHTTDNRLCMFASKPAPVQVTWLGYPNTTGIKEIDYRLTDAIADPVGKDDDFYIENLIRIQDGFLCYEPDKDSPEVSAPPCLRNDTITFGSFNNLAKVTPEVVRVWAKIVLRVPHSRLVLKAKQLIDEFTRARYQEMFAKEGVSSDRVELLSKVFEMVDHLATYNRIDIALDPFPYNGTTTTCEALWMGVPVVALLGDRHSGRVGASILHAVGLAESLVAKDKESYIAKAVALADDKEKLQIIRKNLRQQMQYSPLCDAASFAKNVEDAYWNMWERFTEDIAEDIQEKK